MGVCDDSGVRKRVLIVDDHEPFRAVARELLERAGFVVAGEAGDAAEALAAVAAESFDFRMKPRAPHAATRWP